METLYGKSIIYQSNVNICTCIKKNKKHTIKLFHNYDSKIGLKYLLYFGKNTYFWLNDKTSYFLFLHMNNVSFKTLLNIIKVNVNTMNFNS